jgi:hypothetical protein
MVVTGIKQHRGISAQLDPCLREKVAVCYALEDPQAVESEELG